MGMSNVRPTVDEEIALWNKGYWVVGVDEVGRGAFAGPLVVGAVVYPPFFHHNTQCEKILSEVRDSKLLLPEKRVELSSCINKHSIAISLAEVSVRVINKVGVGRANQIGFRKAIQKIQKAFPDKKLFILVDGFHAKYVRGIGLKNQKAIIKGDQKSITIASASIIAKVHRDDIMTKLSRKFPRYLFAQHKGYGTAAHRSFLMKFGMTPIHREVFCRRSLLIASPLLFY